MIEDDNDLTGLNEEKRIIKRKKRSKYRKAFDTFTKDRNCFIIKELNHIIHFIFNMQEYYFTELNGNVLKKGNKKNIFKILEIYQNQ